MKSLRSFFTFIGRGLSSIAVACRTDFIGNTLYGAAYGGGSSGNGTVFSLSLGSVSAPAPTLTIFPSGTNVVLTWPTNATAFTLQSTTNLVSTTVWSNVSPAAVVVNTNNAVTNAISDKQKFYRLSQ